MSTTAKTPVAPTKAVRKPASNTRPRSGSAKKSVSTGVRKAVAAPVKEASKPTTPAKSATPATAPKDKKVKVVRDSYTIPKSEYGQLGELKKRTLGLGVAAKKSELIRAGLLLLAKQNDIQLKASLSQVPAIKTGRPAKG